MGPIRATRAYPEAILPTLADIYDKVSGELQKNGYDCECLGGGRISHQSQDRKIHVYGYSMVSSGPQSLGQTDLVIATPRPATQTTSGTHKVEATEPFKNLTSFPPHFPYDIRVVGSHLPWAVLPHPRALWICVLALLGAGRLGAVSAGVKLKALAISISFHKDHPQASGITYPAHSVPSMVRMVGFGYFSPPCYYCGCWVDSESKRPGRLVVIFSLGLWSCPALRFN